MASISAALAIRLRSSTGCGNATGLPRRVYKDICWREVNIRRAFGLPLGDDDIGGDHHVRPFQLAGRIEASAVKVERGLQSTGREMRCERKGASRAWLPLMPEHARSQDKKVGLSAALRESPGQPAPDPQLQEMSQFLHILRKCFGVVSQIPSQRTGGEPVGSRSAPPVRGRCRPDRVSLASQTAQPR